METAAAALRFHGGVYPVCVTLRCDARCTWCDTCRTAPPPGGWDRAPAGDPGNDPRVLRLHGGDALRYGDLESWVRWARGNARAWLEVEGPAEALGGDDAENVAARLRAARPDGISVVLPTLDPARTEALTGRAWDPGRVLASLASLTSDVAVAVVFPVNPGTVNELGETVLRVAEALGPQVDVVLRRAPERRPARGRLPLLGEGDAWAELDALSAEIATLPASLPKGARLRMDARQGYPPCVLAPEALRTDLVRARDGSPRPEAPLGAACAGCAWRPRCTWDPRQGTPPSVRVRPLDEEVARAVQSGALDRAAAHRPHAPGVRRDRAAHGLPDLLCVAPWTSFSATEPDVHPVPCAISWVQNSVALEDRAAALELPVDAVRALDARAKTLGLARWFSLDNEELSLDELWNNPLLRRMRRQMRGGGPSQHCRAMCRVIMGVEDRGADFLARRDADLSAAVAENRRRLVAELCEGRDLLTARPLELTLGVASHCNITCGFCDGPAGRYGELSDRRRAEIEAWLPTLMSFGVSGPGEPLMSRNYLALLGTIAREAYPSLAMSLTTNGTLITPSFLARHAGVRWSNVRISLNAGYAEAHARMTGRALFDTVRENLDALCALRDRTTPPFEVTLSCVLSEYAIGSLHAFAELVTGYRANVIVEPVYGNLDGISAWTRPARLAVLADELGSVAEAFALRNPPLARAFTAVHEFARTRLAGNDFSPLPHR